MKCKHCGAEMPKEASVCPYCDAVVEQKQVPVTPAAKQSPAQAPAAGAAPTQKNTAIVRNPLVGKKYILVSKKGANMAGFFDSKITNTVEVAEDRLLISTKPKRLNHVPALILDDITAIEITRKLNLYYLILIILMVVGAYFNMYLLILAILFWLIGRDHKIRITQRNGKDVILYSADKDQAESFRNDMKTITKIV